MAVEDAEVQCQQEQDERGERRVEPPVFSERNSIIGVGAFEQGDGRRNRHETTLHQLDTVRALRGLLQNLKRQVRNLTNEDRYTRGWLCERRFARYAQKCEYYPGSCDLSISAAFTHSIVVKRLIVARDWHLGLPSLPGAIDSL